MRSLRKNILFNFGGQIYVGLIGVLTLPAYLKLLGAESYGLIGVYTLLQAWMQMLDLGLTPTLSREVAASRGSDLSDTCRVRRLVNSLELVFIIVACLAALIIYFSSDWVASEWLSFDELSDGLVSSCLFLMGLVVSIRWPSMLYRGGVNGYERQMWVSIANVAFATLRFPAPLLLIWLGGIGVYGYFLLQVLVSVAELVVFKLKMDSLIPAGNRRVPFFSATAIKEVLPFAASSAYVGLLWVLVTQLDKLILTKTLSLKEYGYFSLVATISSVVLVVSTPISTAILPRMTALLAGGDREGMLRVYRLSSRFLVCIMAPVVTMAILYPYEVIHLWTGNETAAVWAEQVFPLFVLGNALLAVGAFQSYLQYADGDISLNVKYNTVTTVLSIPAIYYFAVNYGAVGAGAVWVAFRLFTLVFWTYFVHRILAPGMHAKWLLVDVLVPSALSTAFMVIVFYASGKYFPGDLLRALAYSVLLVGAAVLLSCVVGFYKESKAVFCTLLARFGWGV